MITNQQREDEAETILKLDKDQFVIVLDERGKQLSSPEFAELIREVLYDFGPGKNPVAVIGGSHGLDDSDPQTREFSFRLLTYDFHSRNGTSFSQRTDLSSIYNLDRKALS